MRPAGATPPAALEVGARGSEPASNSHGDPKPPRPDTDQCSLDPCDARDGDDDNFVKLTVHLTHEAFACLQDASDMTGDTRTDVVNRALALYAAVQGAAAHGGGNLTFRSRSGQKHQVVVA